MVLSFSAASAFVIGILEIKGRYITYSQREIIDPSHKKEISFTCSLVIKLKRIDPEFQVMRGFSQKIPADVLLLSALFWGKNMLFGRFLD